MLYKTIILLFLTTLISGASTERIGLFPYWSQGDSAKVLVSEGFIEYKGDKVVKKEVETSEVIINVLEETDSTYLIEWNYLNPTYDRVNIEMEEEDDFDRRLDAMFGNFKVYYQIDESGNFIGLSRTEAMNQMIVDSLDVLFKEEFDGSKKEAKFMKELLTEMMGTEAMQSEWERDFINYHYYHGTSLTMDTIIYFDDEIENKLSGEMIPLKGIYQSVTDVDSELIYIRETKDMSSENLKSHLIDAGAVITDQEQKDVFAQEIKENDIYIIDKDNYTYNYVTGWLQDFENVRIMTTVESRRESFVRIKAID